MGAVPNTPGVVKHLAFATGIGSGVGVQTLLERNFTEPDRAEDLEKRGIHVLDSRQLSVYAMAAPFIFAAGIGLGMQRRSPTAGLTTTQQIAAGALLSTVAGMVINANSPKAGDYVTGTAATSALLGAGVLLGVQDEVHMGKVRLLGLGAFGTAIGIAAPMLLDSISEAPGALQRSFEHRER